MLLGNWKIAIQAAEMVLMTDGYNYKGILIKAEALFNLCYFEHAMVLFHRGRVMFPESEEFRFGVHKCRKTILDGVSRGSIYLGGGVMTMFRVMRKLTEMRSVDRIGGTAAGFGGTLGSMRQSGFFLGRTFPLKCHRRNHRCGTDFLSTIFYN